MVVVTEQSPMTPLGRFVRTAGLSIVRNAYMAYYNRDNPGVMEDALLKAYRCRRYVETRNKKLRFFACKQRHCLGCQLCAMVKRIYFYYSAVLRLATEYDLYSFSLTLRNCAIADLRDTAEEMIRNWQLIVKLYREQHDDKLSGLRVFECHPTLVNQVKNDFLLAKAIDRQDCEDIRYYRYRKQLSLNGGFEYHPHFHLLVATKRAASFITRQWAKRFGHRYSKKSLKISHVSSKESMKGLQGYRLEGVSLKPYMGLESLNVDRSVPSDRLLMDFFKYMSKGVEKRPQVAPTGPFAQALCKMFGALKGYRSVRPFGVLASKAYKEEARDTFGELDVDEGVEIEHTALEVDVKDTFFAFDRSVFNYVSDEVGMLSKPTDFNPLVHLSRQKYESFRSVEHQLAVGL